MHLYKNHLARSWDIWFFVKDEKNAQSYQSQSIQTTDNE